MAGEGHRPVVSVGDPFGRGRPSAGNSHRSDAGTVAKYEANLDRLLAGLNERDRIIEREEAKIHERLNRHRYDIREKDKVIQGIDRRVGIQAHEIDSLKERVSYYDDRLLDVSLLRC